MWNLMRSLSGTAAGEVTRSDHRCLDEGRLRADLVVRDVEDELLVLDPSADQVHQLNRSAALIWRLYGGGASLDEIAASMASEFEVSVETAKKDAEGTLLRFRALSLIQ